MQVVARLTWRAQELRKAAGARGGVAPGGEVTAFEAEVQRVLRATEQLTSVARSPLPTSVAMVSAVKNIFLSRLLVSTTTIQLQ